MSDESSDATISAEDLAEQLGCATAQVIRWIEHGRLVASQAGSPWMIRKADANAWSKSKGAGMLFPEAGVGISGEAMTRADAEGADEEEGGASPSPAVEVDRQAATSREDQFQGVNPLSSPARSRTRDDIQSLSSVDAEQEAQVYFERAADAYESLNFEPALRNFQKAYDANPDEPLYAAFYAYLRFMSDPAHSETAEQLLADVVDEAEDPAVRAYAHLFWGRIQKANDQHDEAREQFERSLDADPAFQKARNELRRYRDKDEANQSGIRKFLDGMTGDE